LLFLLSFFLLSSPFPSKLPSVLIFSFFHSIFIFLPFLTSFVVHFRLKAYIKHCGHLLSHALDCYDVNVCMSCTVVQDAGKNFSKLSTNVNVILLTNILSNLGKDFPDAFKYVQESTRYHRNMPNYHRVSRKSFTGRFTYTYSTGVHKIHLKISERCYKISLVNNSPSVCLSTQSGQCRDSNNGETHHWLLLYKAHFVSQDDVCLLSFRCACPCVWI
jgi:hypothetical protein